MAAPEPEPDPAIELGAGMSARALYAFHLKRLRRERKVSQKQAAESIPVSTSLISGIELRTRTPSRAVSRGLDAYFGLGCFFTWLQPHVVEEVGLPAGFLEFTDVEGEAVMIMMYENFAITGLFQIEEYARAVLRAATKPEKLDNLVATRLERQEIIHRENPPQIILVVDEYALRRRFGDRETRIKQLEHLLKLIEMPNISIYVVEDRGEIATEGTFTLLRTPEGVTTGYFEGPRGRGQLIDEPDYVSELEVLFERIREKALSASDSERFIRDLLGELHEGH